MSIIDLTGSFFTKYQGKNMVKYSFPEQSVIKLPNNNFFVV
jgi:hypothetical protein